MKSSILSATVLATALAIGSAQAATVTVNTDSSSVATTTALTGFATNGAQMDGMRVTARFANGGSETLSWAGTGAISGGVNGTMFSLNLSGDTFSADWTLVNLSGSALTELAIDAGVGNTVFDTNLGSDTPGSAGGLAFQDRSGLLGDIFATYSLAVALTGFAPAGDLFARLLVDFTGLADTGVLGGYAFGSDTDNLLLAGDLNPVPIPGALPLFASVLGVGGFLRYRKRKAATA